MRRPTWSRRLVPMIIGSVAVILSMEVAAPASADTNPQLSREGRSDG